MLGDSNETSNEIMFKTKFMDEINNSIEREKLQKEEKDKEKIAKI